MRYARPSDAPAVAALLREVALDRQLLFAPEDVDEAAVARDLEEGPGLRVVAVRPEVVGYLELVPGRFETVSRTVELRMGVRRDWQGKGIGAELLRFGVGWADGGAADRIELFVRAGNVRAIDLYHRFGFLEEGRLRRRVRLPGGEVQDDVLMARLFGAEQG